MMQRWCGVVKRSRILSSVTTNSSSSKMIASKAIRPAFCALREISSHSTQVKHSQSDNGGEVVHFLALNKLSDNPGAIKKKRRVGRGVGSSKGKTCGRGHKGQKSRSNPGIHPGFEGGQTKLYKRIPKRGFTNVHATPMLPLNLGTLQDFVDMGRLLPPKHDDPPLNMKDLVEAGIAKNSAIKHGMKLLAKGKERLRSPLKLEVSRASRTAIEALEAVGGEVTTVHYNRLALRALLKPQKFQIIPKFAAPPPKLLPYYTNYKNRGYLSPEVQKRKLLMNDSSNEQKN